MLIQDFYRIVLFIPFLWSYQALSQNEWIHNPDYLLTDTIVQYYSKSVKSIDLYNCQGKDTLSQVSFVFSRVINPDTVRANTTDSSDFFQKITISSGDLFEIFRVETYNDTTLLITNNETLTCITNGGTTTFNEEVHFHSPFNSDFVSDLYNVDSIKVVNRRGNFKRSSSEHLMYRNGIMTIEKSDGKKISRRQTERIMKNKEIENPEKFDWCYYVVCEISNNGITIRKEYLYYFIDNRLTSKYCIAENPGEVWEIYRFW